MIRVGDHVDVEIDSRHGPVSERCSVSTAKRWTIELQRTGLPFTPDEDTMVRLHTARGVFIATVQRSDLTTFEILRPLDLVILPDLGRGDETR